ncbi:hypothetical protein PV325_011843 [Microctonus aethiopoides]|uniref:FP protein C-terminal domain-containing protein n=1 Tax=Microctonus aethiopoides TaxID=144406 RepID=A0AA39FWS8_9HYME|nr:hypothetical protein PV325_011843 [Microctonus aethiopoides]KAK0072854.1 hypothetical protein PV326_014063 [Microctonus aethiopoides]KAK0176915.1 hypothetical protein PV328_001013 [Microctonus aethiopoides]
MKKLEQQNEAITKNLSDLAPQNNALLAAVETLKSSAGSPVNSSSELVISGIPSQVTSDSHSINSNMLTLLDCEQLASDVLDIRTVSHKNDLSTATENRVNEFLMPFTHRLYRKAKEIAKAHKVKYIWVMNGQVYACKGDITDKINIATEADLDLLKSN